MVAIETPVTSMPSASPLTSTSVQEEKHLVYPEEWRHVDQVINASCVAKNSTLFLVMHKNII